jgi:hypothetical protein
MDCELNGDEKSLGQLIKTLDKESKGYYQARELIEKHGFKKEHILCADCFWK